MSEKIMKYTHLEENIYSKLISVLTMGGKLFRYLDDKKFDSISIFGVDNFVCKIIEHAKFAGIPIKAYISDIDRSLPVNLPFYYKQTFLNMDSVKLNPNDAIVICCLDQNHDLFQKLKNITPNVFFISSLLNYDYTKFSFLNELDSIRNNNPNVPFILCNIMSIFNIKNPSDIETYVKENVKSGDIQIDLNLHPDVVNKVFRIHGFSDKYIKEVTSYYKRIQRNGIYYFEDYKSEYFNVIHGFRVTTDLPNNADRGNIYIFGNSVPRGAGADDSNTIASCLQRELNKFYNNGKSYNVFNCATASGSQNKEVIELMQTISFKANDIVICCQHFDSLTQDVYKDKLAICILDKYFQRPHNFGEMFFDNSHFNFMGHRIMAGALFDTLLENNLISKGDYVENTELQSLQNESIVTSEVITVADKIVREIVQTETKKVKSKPEQSEYEELTTYLNELKTYKIDVEGKIGGIVVNCNPFTLGHRYLIEHASSKVAHLFVFVVEEDKSVFPFKDRLQLVKEGTSDLKNVTVLPSGQFIISTKTFEEYFEKDKLAEVVIDPSNDLTIFAEKIAPTLNISIRLVGDEPNCNITRQYNAAMKRILPEYNIDVEIIKRKESDGEPISASRVRRLLENKDFEAISKIVPPTTLNYLIKKFS